MEEAYKRTVWILPDDYLSFERYERCLYGLDRTSSPGWPYMKQSPTIGEWLEFDGIKYGAYKVQSLWFDVLSVLSGEYDIVFRVFVKQEPHRIDKCEDNRWRLIVASPLCVQVVWQMLFHYQNDLEIDACYEIPSQQGIVLINGGWKQYLELWTRRGYDTGLDKRAWDWTAPGWLLYLDLEFRRRMGRGDKMAEWYVTAKKCYDDMFKTCVLTLSDGTRWRQLYPGIMKSGCVNTISTNSHMQVMIHFLACWDQGISPYPVCVAVGDDTLQCSRQAVDIQAYSKFGAIVKSASDGLEFVGHEMLKSGPQPLYMEKHFVKFLHVPEDFMADYLDSMARMYCHTEMFYVWDRLARRLGINIMSRDYYLWWYDHEDFGGDIRDHEIKPLVIADSFFE